MRLPLGAFVLAALVVGCGSNRAVTIVGPPRPDPQVVYPLAVTGPPADRRPTLAERRAIVAATRAAHRLNGRDACITYRVRVSRFDAGYAVVRYVFGKKHRQNCLLGNGWTIMWKHAGRWQVKGDAGDGFSCDYAPAGVIISLDGACLVQIHGPSRPDSETTAAIRAALAHAGQIRALGRSRLRLDDVWISRTRDFAAAELVGTTATDNFFRMALLVHHGHWRVVAVARDVDFCRYAPSDDMAELNLRC